MNKYPIVSVIMPVYNGEKTIKIALNSLHNQSYIYWKCIIVNDGSTDNTKKILDSIKDERFKIIHLEKNVGRGAARQIALDNVDGDYIAFLDADDFFHSNKIMRNVSVLDNNQEIALVASLIGTYNKLNELVRVRGKKGSYSYLYGDNLTFTPASSMIRIEFAKKIKYQSNLNAAEDVDYFSRYLEGKKYEVLDEVLYYYYEFESATYSKILEYTKFELKRVLSTNSKLKLKILKKSVLIIIKYLIYLTFIPILGVDFFLRRRGVEPELDKKEEFYKEFRKSTKFI